MALTAYRVAKNYWPENNTLDWMGDWYGWAFPNTTNFRDHQEKYNSIATWIQATIPNYKENARWKKVNDCFYVKFRNEKDAVLFTLKFGHPNHNDITQSI